MLKSFGIGALVLLGLGTAWACADRGCYFATAASQVASRAADAVPLTFEIDRAKSMLAQIDPDIRRNMHVIAEGEAAVEKLRTQISDMQKQQDGVKGAMLRLKGDLETKQASYNYAGKIYTVGEVKQDLKRRLDRYQVQEDTLKKMKEILDARQRTLDSAEVKLRNMQSAKRQLEVDIANLEAQLKLFEATQAARDYQFDDSQLARTKELVSKLQTRLDVASRLVAADEHGGEIALEEVKHEDVLEEVTRVLSGENGMIALEPSTKAETVSHSK